MKPLDQATILDALRQVIDPELDCNLVDLGLIYATRIDGGRVRISMTLTTPGCPMHESLVEGVKGMVGGLPGVTEVEVEVVWDPPWHPGMMTEQGREWVGWS
ncbi:MAG: metal-sulfur cluster assembly factor [Limisphaerales bacterium]